MSRITSQHHCRVVPLHVQVLVPCHCFSPPLTHNLALVPVVVVEERRGWDWGAEWQINTVTSNTRQLPGVWPRLGQHWSEDAGITITSSPPLPSSFQLIAKWSTVPILFCIKNIKM